ncbi:MAG TPA: hypothetical protein PKA55_17935 [Rhodoblastus sp.]|nr:hypothetical protein [Rhodoblastus sp.]
MKQVGPVGGTSRDDGVAIVARGLLLVLAAPSIAALVLDETSHAAKALRMLADVATVPSFFAVAGWLACTPVAAPRLAAVVRAGLPVALCGLAGAFVAAALAPLAGLDAQSGLARAAPVWGLALLPAIYAFVARALRASPVALGAVAIAAHVLGVVLDKPALIHFIFYLVGMTLAARRDLLAKLVADEPEFAFAGGPFVAVLAAAVAIRFSQTGQAPSIAAIGPIALALGLAAGPAMLASAMALGASPAGEALARLGRVAPALAVLWIPLFSALLAAASRGLAPSAPSALLMAIASLLLIAVLADIVLDAAERAGFRRETASF